MTAGRTSRPQRLKTDSIMWERRVAFLCWTDAPVGTGRPVAQRREASRLSPKGLRGAYPCEQSEPKRKAPCIGSVQGFSEFDGSPHPEKV